MDGGCIEVKRLAAEPVPLLMMKSAVVVNGSPRIFVVTRDEFTAFAKGVMNGEFNEFIEP